MLNLNQTSDSKSSDQAMNDERKTLKTNFGALNAIYTISMQLALLIFLKVKISMFFGVWPYFSGSRVLALELWSPGVSFLIHRLQKSVSCDVSEPGCIN